MDEREGRRGWRRVERDLLGEQAPPQPRPPVTTPPVAPRRRPRTRLATASDDASPLERALAPGCLISLAITALLLVAFRRLTSLPPPMLIVLAVVVFVTVLFVMLRVRPVRIDDNDRPPRG
jgi:hypothetical protein